jgi:hypothetical protein
MRLVSIVFLSGLCGAAAGAQERGVITGDYVEDRSNHVHGFYCEWSGEAVAGGREALVAWRIRSGAFGGADLAGVAIAAVLRGERTLSAGAPPRRSALLISASATPQQRLAAESLIREWYGALIGQVLAVRAVPLEFELTGEAARVRAPGLLAIVMRKARAPEDVRPGAIKWYDPFIALSSFELGVTTEAQYSGGELGLTWNRTTPATTGYFGSFRLQAR